MGGARRVRRVAAVIAVWSSLARAEDPAVTALSWSAPPECPGENDFVTEVERFLGQSLGSRRDQQIEIAGSVSRDPAAGYVPAPPAWVVDLTQLST
ncbi:MAG: hypothetical protein JW751_07045 [Polyangiaceae bacterium]|nr:hypothetical protein [Polyangiaceae bacterium]